VVCARGYLSSGCVWHIRCESRTVCCGQDGSNSYYHPSHSIQCNFHIGCATQNRYSDIPKHIPPELLTPDTAPIPDLTNVQATTNHLTFTHRHTHYTRNPQQQLQQPPQSQRHPRRKEEHPHMATQRMFPASTHITRNLHFFEKPKISTQKACPAHWTT
jgi:hypothetical protein